MKEKNAYKTRDTSNTPSPHCLPMSGWLLAVVALLNEVNASDSWINGALTMNELSDDNDKAKSHAPQKEI